MWCDSEIAQLSFARLVPGSISGPTVLIEIFRVPSIDKANSTMDAYFGSRPTIPSHLFPTNLILNSETLLVKKTFVHLMGC